LRRMGRTSGDKTRSFLMWPLYCLLLVVVTRYTVVALIWGYLTFDARPSRCSRTAVVATDWVLATRVHRKVWDLDEDEVMLEEKFWSFRQVRILPDRL
jgi:hypothetical protein